MTAQTPPAPDGALNHRSCLPGLTRSGNPSRLTPAGQQQLLALNFSRLIDLRDRTERTVDPPPSWATPPT
ncbi:tyrosine-protein phosphatase [Deinococcus aquaticus]|uniref:tyrosine-protein phosphatase n=1 Tax=Deinococcus aquaticus TaxID=328692 RepID=UPI0036200700